MSTITARLRAQADHLASFDSGSGDAQLLREAAAELNRGAVSENSFRYQCAALTHENNLALDVLRLALVVITDDIKDSGARHDGKDIKAREAIKQVIEILEGVA